MENNLEKIKKEYMKTPIPEKLEFIVNKSIKESKMKLRKRNKHKNLLIATTSVAAAVIILFVGISSSESVAYALSDVPILGSLVKVLTNKEYTVQEDTYKANLEAPVVEGLENKELQNSLNEKYLEENKELYTQFVKDMEDLKKNGGGHLGIDSGYVIKTDTDNILSIGRYVVNTVGSSSTTFKYNTIDKKKEVLITLPSLFKDDRYINIISQYIKNQMVEKNDPENDVIYWSNDFETISENQEFYISTEGKLVISFNKYQVGPGSMGIIEFIIPTEILSDILVGNQYIY